MPLNFQFIRNMGNMQFGTNPTEIKTIKAWLDLARKPPEGEDESHYAVPAAVMGNKTCWVLTNFYSMQSGEKHPRIADYTYSSAYDFRIRVKVDEKVYEVRFRTVEGIGLETHTKEYGPSLSAAKASKGKVVQFGTQYGYRVTGIYLVPNTGVAVTTYNEKLGVSVVDHGVVPFEISGNTGFGGKNGPNSME